MDSWRGPSANGDTWYPLHVSLNPTRRGGRLPLSFPWIKPRNEIRGKLGRRRRRRSSSSSWSRPQITRERSAQPARINAAAAATRDRERKKNNKICFSLLTFSHASYCHIIWNMILLYHTQHHTCVRSLFQRSRSKIKIFFLILIRSSKRSHFEQWSDHYQDQRSRSFTLWILYIRIHMFIASRPTWVR